MFWKQWSEACTVRLTVAIFSAWFLLQTFGLRAEETRIEVAPSAVIRRLPRTQTGVCIEDVNHEIYGGLYSQMIFGESFQEPAKNALDGFQTFGGSWTVTGGGELVGRGRAYPKAVSEKPALKSDSSATVEIFFEEARDAMAGLIFHVENARLGVDDFTGYEVALNPGTHTVRLGRHQDNFQLIQDVQCPVPVGQWVRLSVRMVGSTLEVFVGDRSVIKHDGGSTAFRSGRVGIRQGEALVRYRRLATWDLSREEEAVPFRRVTGVEASVSGDWHGFCAGTAVGETRLEAQRPFVGQQSQRLTFVGGEGQVGIANAGLFGRPRVAPVVTNEASEGQGMFFAAGKPYEGCVWARAEKACDLTVGLDNMDGEVVHAEQILHVPGGDQWQRMDFVLTPKRKERSGRFAVKLTAPGSVVLGYAFLQPGEWGRFKGLPVRRDMVGGLLEQGVTVMRYGGSMVNAPDYHWKYMIGPREQRPPYRGTWYPYSTNGWAIPDFLNLCEAMGILGIPDLNVNETPADLADFVEYVNGSAESPWGRQRAADGHPAPYGLRYLELGNEEKVDEDYWRKFQPLAEAIWTKDSQIVLVVGDFAYTKPIVDPFRFDGADSGITTLAAQRKILALARQHDREVWFDVHVNTELPEPVSGSLRSLPSYIDAIDKISDGAKHRVVCFELNANTHDQNRGLSNAAAILLAERLGERLPVVTSANALQPDGHQDNGWDQGLLFLDAERVWLQPPGYVNQVFARNFQPLLVRSVVTPGDAKLDVCATRSEGAGEVVVQVSNPTELPVSARLVVPGYLSNGGGGFREELAGPGSGVNTAGRPQQVIPNREVWQPRLREGEAEEVFAPRSLTVLRLKR